MSTSEIVTQALASLNRAKKAAAEMGKARMAAESSHATAVAEAMANGEVIPDKPLDLISLQEADAAAGQALVILEGKLTAAQQAHTSSEWGAAEAAIRARAELRAARIGRALATIRAAITACAGEMARPEEMARHLASFALSVRPTGRGDYADDRAAACARASAVGRNVEHLASSLESSVDYPALLNSSTLHEEVIAAANELILHGVSATV